MNTILWIYKISIPLGIILFVLDHVKYAKFQAKNMIRVNGAYYLRKARRK